MPDIHVYMLDIWLMYIEEARRSCILFVNLDGLRFQRRWLPLMLTDYSIQSFLHGLCMLSADGAWSRQSSIVSEGARTVVLEPSIQLECVCLSMVRMPVWLSGCLPFCLLTFLSETGSLCVSLCICVCVSLSVSLCLSGYLCIYIRIQYISSFVREELRWLPLCQTHRA